MLGAPSIPAVRRGSYNDRVQLRCASGVLALVNVKGRLLSSCSRVRSATPKKETRRENEPFYSSHLTSIAKDTTWTEL